ncbi:MAG: dimethylarginine dimethylaminohydrolase family protein [Candidatus Baltobacteraceae bacterium]
MRPGTPVDAARAQRQWQAVVDAFARSGLAIHELAPVQGCEDMVFTANPAFTGIDARGVRRSIASRMRYPSRRPEVFAQIEYLSSLRYESAPSISGSIGFEGGGDAVWDFERNVIYLGVGPRTDAAIAPLLEKIYGVDVIPLILKTDRFYHLDTALAILDDQSAILYPAAFDDASYAALGRRFSAPIEVDEAEANRMACNAAKAGGNTVVIDASAATTIAQLSLRGYRVEAVDTSEFMKSGGSVYCMKQYIF